MFTDKIFNSCVLLCLTFVFLLIFNSCEKSSPIEPESLPGNRSYSWTADTIFTPKGGLLYLTRMWGSDPENIWATGFGSPYNILLWHYDGKHWKTDSSTVVWTPSAIYGFGRNSVWIGNTSNEFWRCTDSKYWYKYSEQSLPGYPYVCILGMWGVSEGEIYAVGYAEDSTRKKFKMAIERFDGISWKFINTPDISVELVFVRKQMESGHLILGGVNIDAMTGDTYKIYSYDGKEIKELYSGRNPATISEMNGELYIDIGQQIYKYKDGQLKQWKDLRNTIFYQRIWGRNENDFFFNSWQKGKFGIGHYNGTDLQTLYMPVHNLPTYEAVLFDKDIFFLTHDDNNNLSIVIHGKKEVFRAEKN